jgi:hypothetical protein
MAIWHISWPFGMLWQFGICYGNLVYVMAIWYMLWQFGIGMLWQFGICMLRLFSICVDYLVNCSRFGMFYQEKSGNPAWSSQPLGIIEIEIERKTRTSCEKK